MNRYDSFFFFGRKVGVGEEMIFIQYIYNTHTHTKTQGGENPCKLGQGWSGQDGVGTICHPYIIYKSCRTIDWW